MQAKEPVAHSGKSAFHAPGLPDADDLELRAGLMQRIGETGAARGLAQIQADESMSVDRPRVSALLIGKIGKFSTDLLLKAPIAKASSSGDIRRRDTWGARA